MRAGLEAKPQAWACPPLVSGDGRFCLGPPPAPLAAPTTWSQSHPSDRSLREAELTAFLSPKPAWGRLGTRTRPELDARRWPDAASSLSRSWESWSATASASLGPGRPWLVQKLWAHGHVPSSSRASGRGAGRGVQGGGGRSLCWDALRCPGHHLVPGQQPGQRRHGGCVFL